jgi:hypothetical protein
MTDTLKIVNFIVIGSVLFPVVVLILAFGGVISESASVAWIVGWIIVFLGFVFELLFVKRGLVRSDKSFMRNILGAVLIRLLTTAVMVYICLSFLELNQNNFIFSILISYFFYLIIEIVYLNFRNY